LDGVSESVLYVAGVRLVADPPRGGFGAALIARRIAGRGRRIGAQARSRVEIRARDAVVIRSGGECGASGHQPSDSDQTDDEFHGGDTP